MPNFSSRCLVNGPYSRAEGCCGRSSRSPRTTTQAVAKEDGSVKTLRMRAASNSRSTATMRSPVRTAAGGFITFQRPSTPDGSTSITCMVPLQSFACVI